MIHLTSGTIGQWNRPPLSAIVMRMMQRTRLSRSQIDASDLNAGYHSDLTYDVGRTELTNPQFTACIDRDV